MRKETKTYNVYKYDELSKEVQERLLEAYMQEEFELYCEYTLQDDMIYEASMLLQEYFKGAKFRDTYYDLDYSQGNGSVILFDIDLLDLNKKYNVLNEEEIKELENYSLLPIKVVHSNNYYCHERSFSICDNNDYNIYDLEDIEGMHERLDTLTDLFYDDIVCMNEKLTKRGYKMIENEEYFKENALNTLNELEFLEDGSVFNE